ncbi:ANTAR domain-containing protein [Streptomyces sp. NPDC002004]
MTSDDRSRAGEVTDAAAEPVPPDETATRVFQLEEEIGQLKQAVHSHATVDQAIGMIVALGRVTPDEGWTILQEVSQHTNIKLRNIAELIIIWGRNGDLPAEVRAELEDAIDRHGPTQVPRGTPQVPGGAQDG